MVIGICFKCGKETTVDGHHVSYFPEIIKPCCRSCHKKIHIRVRKENKCPFSVEETRRLTSMYSSQHWKERNPELRKTIALDWYHRNKERVKEHHVIYHRDAYRNIDFYENMMPNVRLLERVSYNQKTGNVLTSSYFSIHEKNISIKAGRKSGLYQEYNERKFNACDTTA